MEKIINGICLETLLKEMQNTWYHECVAYQGHCFNKDGREARASQHLSNWWIENGSNDHDAIDRKVLQLVNTPEGKEAYFKLVKETRLYCSP